MKGRRVEGKKLRRLKASKPFLHANPDALYDYRHFAAFSDDSVQSKKPSGGPKGLIGPPCHGAWSAEAKNDFFRNFYIRIISCNDHDDYSLDSQYIHKECQYC